MSKISDYQTKLKSLPDWDNYLLAESNLPGPRGNLELAEAVANLGSREQFLNWLEWTPERAPENTPHCFLAFCGTWGLGRLIAEGDEQFISLLQKQASDPRWRVREASAMALQSIGDTNPDLLLKIANIWKKGNYLEQRAVMAGLCEPRLLKKTEFCQQVLTILDEITTEIAATSGNKSEDFRVLRQALGYGWSVAIVSAPELGKTLFEKWAGSNHPDIQWIVKENLKKNRLIKLDHRWVEKMDKLISC
ncbi:MAG: HEAT repeat domain-containing protein [Anaerolineaceae bacterium]